jgi:hypothetical protein
MQGMQGKSNQQIIDENLARGSTIQSLPENFFQTASAGARRVGDYVNQAGNVQQINYSRPILAILNVKFLYLPVLTLLLNRLLLVRYYLLDCRLKAFL